MLPNKTSTSFGEDSGFWLFMKRVLNNPRQLGAVIPSSVQLGREMTNHVDLDGRSPILELGGGTGALTKVLLTSGVAPERIYIVELDAELCQFLKHKFPRCTIVHGCAAELEMILPKEILRKIKVTVSGLPHLNFPKALRASIIHSIFQVMAPDGYLLQYTYSPKSPLPAKDHGLQEEKKGKVLWNVPPATVWKYFR